MDRLIPLSDSCPVLHPQSGSPFLAQLRRFSRSAFVLHGYLIASLVLLPVSGTSLYADDDPPADDPALTSPEPTPEQTPPVAEPSYEPPPDPAVTDSDGDNLSDAQEQAIGSNIYNPDSDGDGLSDADEVDITGTSPTSTDSDDDGYSDYNESYGNYSVNTYDNGQGVTPYDHDGDGYEDPVDPDALSASNIPDSDGDYVPDNEDSDPATPWLWNDANGNGINDDAEPTVGDPNSTPDPGTTPTENPDRDGDGVANDSDSHPDHPSLFNDWNWNGTNDQEEDWDGDGVINLQDSHPNSNVLWCDWNQNGTNDDMETASIDSDGDSTPDGSDSDPDNASLWSDWNRNGTNDEQEGTPPPTDSDGDTHPDDSDSDPNNSSLWEDWNHNGTNDGEESPVDSDGDGHTDNADTDPNNSSLWADYNRNGYNDGEEPPGLDSDSDGTPDVNDSHPNDINLWCDWNGNSFNDFVDNADDDGDGRSNINDSHPQNNQLWNDRNNNGTNDEDEIIIVDTDGDGYSDTLDTHPSDGNLWNDHDNDGINDENQTPPDSDNDGIADVEDQFPLDFDNDGIDDLTELANSTNPALSDTDSDGLSDGEEYFVGSDPQTVDTDQDGLTDYEEAYAYQSSPAQPTTIIAAGPNTESTPQSVAPTPGMVSATLMKNGFKALLGVKEVSLVDSDSDGIPDKVELLYAPLMNKDDPLDAAGDLDSDGVTNFDQFLQGRDLRSNTVATDTDGDGITNKVEDTYSITKVRLPKSGGGYTLSVGVGALNRHRSSDATEDFDHDNIVNIEEVNGMWHLNPATFTASTAAFSLPKSNPNLKFSGGCKPAIAPSTVFVNDPTTYYPLLVQSDGVQLLEQPDVGFTDWQLRGALAACKWTSSTAFPGGLAAKNAVISVITSLFSASDAIKRASAIRKWKLLSALNKQTLSQMLTSVQDPTCQSISDRDDDGLPDAWEHAYRFSFRSPDNAGPLTRTLPVTVPATRPAMVQRPTTPYDPFGDSSSVQAWMDYYAWLDYPILNVADPDHDGVSTLREYFAGSHPTIPDYVIADSDQPIVIGDDVSLFYCGKRPISTSPLPPATDLAVEVTSPPPGTPMGVGLAPFSIPVKTVLTYDTSTGLQPDPSEQLPITIEATFDTYFEGHDLPPTPGCPAIVFTDNDADSSPVSELDFSTLNNAITPLPVVIRQKEAFWRDLRLTFTSSLLPAWSHTIVAATIPPDHPINGIPDGTPSIVASLLPPLMPLPPVAGGASFLPASISPSSLPPQPGTIQIVESTGQGCVRAGERSKTHTLRDSAKSSFAEDFNTAQSRTHFQASNSKQELTRSSDLSADPSVISSTDDNFTSRTVFSSHSRVRQSVTSSTTQNSKISGEVKSSDYKWANLYRRRAGEGDAHWTQEEMYLYKSRILPKVPGQGDINYAGKTFNSSRGSSSLTGDPFTAIHPFLASMPSVLVGKKVNSEVTDGGLYHTSSLTKWQNEAMPSWSSHLNKAAGNGMSRHRVAPSAPLASLYSAALADADRQAMETPQRLATEVLGYVVYDDSSGTNYPVQAQVSRYQFWCTLGEPGDIATRTSLVKITDKVILNNGTVQTDEQFKTISLQPGETTDGGIASIPTITTGNKHNDVIYASTAVTLLPVEFKKMWETKNKANQVFNPARKDDPKASITEPPDAAGSVHGVDTNHLYVVVDPTDNKLGVTVDVVVGGDPTKWVAAAFNGGSKVSGSDTVFPASGPVEMHIPHGDELAVRVGYDANGNSQLDTAEEIKLSMAAKFDKSANGEPTVKGISSAKYSAMSAAASGVIALGYTIPHSAEFLRLFRDGTTTGMPADKRPTPPPGNFTMDAFKGELSEWLTHNSGAEFSDDGIADIPFYHWDATTSAGELAGLSHTVKTAVQSHFDTAIMPQVTAHFASLPPGAQADFPQGGLATITHAHQSTPPWVPKTTVLFDNPYLYDKGLDDVFGVIGRGRVPQHQAKYTVKKVEYDEYVGDDPTGGPIFRKTIGYDVTARTVGSVTDIYDFNYNAGTINIIGATLQLGYGKGTYGRTAGKIYRWDINWDETFDWFKK